jgi:hypothetical protein
MLFRLLASARNTIDNPLRQAFHWRRSGLRYANEPKENLFASLPEAERGQADRAEQRLHEVYHLQGLYTNSTRKNYLENLFYLELLARALDSLSPRLSPSK